MGMQPVTGLLLAAGAGRRFGRPKALVDDGGGPWVLRAVDVLLRGGVDDVVVVTGAAAEEVEALVAGLGDERVSTVRCGTWEEGMGESLRAGLTALATRGRTVPARALVHLVDLPDVGAEVVARLLTSVADSTDALARLGGDEFGMVAGLGEDDADQLVERLRVALDDAGTPCSIGRASVTVTGGFAQACAEADAAMYADKRARKAGR